MIFVLINHGLKWTGTVQGLGRTGVNLFFVISGLLTAISLESIRKKNQNVFVELPRKRAWRIVPTLLAFVLLCCAVRALQGNEESWPGFLYPFWANYASPKGGFSHLWSIACEMHFYLLSPLVFWIGTRGKAGAVALGVIFLALCACAAANAYLQILIEKPIQLKALFDNKYSTHVAVWPMLLGFAWYLNRFRIPEWLAVRFRKHLVALMVIAHAALIGILYVGSPALTVLVSVGLIPLLFFTFQEKRALGGKLGSALVWVGQRTFSIYLIQQMLTLELPAPKEWRPLGALLALPLGAIFYFLVEKRFVASHSKST